MPATLLKRKTHARRRAAERPASTGEWKILRRRGLKVVVCSNFEKFGWLRHGFSTRPDGLSDRTTLENGTECVEKVLNLGFADWDRRDHVEKNRAKFFQAAGAAGMTLVTMTQIHSDIVQVVERTARNPLTGDALVTAAPGMLLSVQSADCFPILFADTKRRVIAAVHAGWRGTLKRIAAKTVGRMQMEFSTRPEDVVATLGPAIRRCCYEVGPEVVKEFSSQFPAAHGWFDGPYDQLAWGEEQNPLAWLTMMPPGRVPPPPTVHLDLGAANCAMLLEAGLREKNIFASDFCTACRTELFFSYRREHETGRLMAVIGILP